MKKIIVLCLTIALIFTLCSCHGSKYNFVFEIPDSFDESKQYNITFWAKNDTNKVQQDIYLSTINRFEEYYPNIKVTIVQYNDYNKIYSNVITNISTNTTPNVCITYPDFVATYIEGNNIVVPLDDLIDDPNFGFGGSKIKFNSVKKEDVIQKFLDECIVRGQYYSIPFMRSSEATYINKEWVEELGYTIPDVLTWDFVWEVCQKALDTKTGNGPLIPLITKSSDNMVIQIAKQYGIDYSTSNGDVLMYNNQMVDKLVELSDYYNKGLFNTFDNVSYPGNFYNRKQCIFAIDSTAGSTWLGSKAPLLDIDRSEVVSFTTVVRPFPQKSADDIQMMSQGPSVCVFNKEDRGEVLASWLFAQFLLNSETQMAYARTEGYVPVTKEAIENIEYQTYLSSPDEDSADNYSVKIDATKLVIDNIDNTFISAVFNGSTRLRYASSYILDQVCKGRSAYSGAEINEILNKSKSLYKITNIKNNSGEVGALPKQAKILIISLVSVWIILIVVYAIKFINMKKRAIKK